MSAASKSREVVLVPGLWMPGAAMALLAARLRRQGHAVRVFSYSGRRPHADNVDVLARFARGDAAFVGHSLGGILVLDMLNGRPDVPAASAVLLGAPARGSLAGRRFGGSAFGRWMLGACRPLWEERAARWTRAAPLGVVAGTLPFGLGRLFGRLPGVNDGVVRAEETAVEGMADRVELRCAHSMLIASGEVARLVDRFLAAGRFA